MRSPTSLLALGVLTIATAGSTTSIAEANDTTPASQCEFNQSIASIAPDFVLPDVIEPGDLVPFRWKEDDSLMDKHGRLVGIPPGVTEELRKLTEESGLNDLFRELVDRDMKRGDGTLHTLNDGRKWSVMSPSGGASYWPGDETRFFWVDAANEESFEETLRALGRGGFDTVLESMAKEYGSEGLMIGGCGFIVVHNVKGGVLHRDLDVEREASWFDLLFPLELPEAGAHLNISNREKTKVGRVDYTPNVGVLLEASTVHATGACNYAATNDFRVAVSIYILDVQDDNKEDFANDDTAYFPVPFLTGWHEASRGRFLKRGSLKNDKGRLPVDNRLPPEDTAMCEQNKHMCETSLAEVRRKCWKTCQVYIDDERYFSEFFPNQEPAEELPTEGRSDAGSSDPPAWE